jgi:exodeoxyribonuclease-3
MDSEGRYIQADFDGLSVASIYIPSGSSGDARQQVKYSFMDRFTETLKAMRRKRREYILCGDWNIVHKEIDIKNWKSNQKTSGCLPEERAWLDQLFGPMGYVDAFRVVNQKPDQYTWWSNRGQAWAKNVGWRIDYHVVTPNLKDRVSSASIYKDQRFSDHAPLIINYKD